MKKSLIALTLGVALVALTSTGYASEKPAAPAAAQTPVAAVKATK